MSVAHGAGQGTIAGAVMTNRHRDVNQIAGAIVASWLWPPWELAFRLGHARLEETSRLWLIGVRMMDHRAGSGRRTIPQPRPGEKKLKKKRNFSSVPLTEKMEQAGLDRRSP
jgi:hypothetical protein